jgi:hypothetical protein
LALCGLILILTACANKPKVLASPQVLIQSLARTETANAKVRFLLHNFSNVPLTFVRVEMQFRIQDQLAAPLDLPLALEIPAESPDSVNASVRLSADAIRALSGSIPLPYTLEGKIWTEKPRRQFDFVYRGELNPTPGVPGAWR